LIWQPYPEDIRETPLGELDVEVYRPAQVQVVMGASGRPEREVYAEALEAAGIPLFKRKGGGGTVVLGPGTIVVTVHAGVIHPFQNLGYFKAINHTLIDVFRHWLDLPFRHSGISDIAVEGRKIVGTSIFRRKQYLLYQASILVEADFDLIHSLLRHPPREPDYRRGRTHRDFITDLRTIGISAPVNQMIQDLQSLLPQQLPGMLEKV